MDSPDVRAIARRWWTCNDERRFAEAAALCAPECRIDWPLSNERFIRPAAWAEAMEHYPGIWRCTVETLLVDGDRVLTIARVADPEGTVSVTAISMFEIRDGRISGLVEYWPDPYDPPDWRKRWVTPIPGVENNVNSEGATLA